MILRLWRLGVFRLVTSVHILTELSRTLQSPYFKQRLTPQQINSAMRLLQRKITSIPITANVHGVATHPEDDVILGTAVSAKADYLVTGDTKLQHLGTYKGVTILSPKQFLATPKDDLFKERTYQGFLRMICVVRNNLLRYTDHICFAGTSKA